MSKTAATAVGVVGLLINPHGAVVAHAADFERQGYGGYKLWEAQKFRVKRAIADNFVSAFTYGDVTVVIDEFQRAEIVQKLVRDHGYSLKFFGIGHDADVE